MKKYLRTYLRGGLLFALFLISSCSLIDLSTTKKNSEEVIYNRVIKITDAAETILNECETLEDAAKRLDEIRALDGVDNVYVSGQCFYVDIKDFFSFCYSYEEQEDINGFSESQLLKEYSALAQNVITRSDGSHPYTSDVKACIMNAQAAERPWTCVIADETKTMFESCGISADVKDASISFYREDIYQYDLFFSIGHGFYDEQTKLHWLQTAETFTFNQTEDEADDLGIALYELISRTYSKDMMLIFLSKKEIRQGVETNPYTYYISEKFIEHFGQSFPHPGKAVVFIINCQSLMGDTTADWSWVGRDVDSKRIRKIDDSMAQAFFDKGVGMYVGYDESSYTTAQLAGLIFYARLLSGESFRNALCDFPDDRYYYATGEHDDGKEYDVAMHLLTANNFDTDSFLTSPSLLSTSDDYFVGQSYYFPPKRLPKNDYYSTYTFIYKDRIEYGFRFSEDNDNSTGTDFSATPTWENDVAQGSYLMIFKTDKISVLKGLEPDTHYYVWPYVKDGSSYNFGDKFEYTTDRIRTVVPEEYLEDIAPYIPIHNGNNPPKIEGQFLMSPLTLVHSSGGGYEPGDVFNDLYLMFYNQDMKNNTLDYMEAQASSSATGTGAFISGEGNDFTVFFNTEGINHYSDYDINTKKALILSGTKTSEGIKDLYYTFVMVDKSNDPKNHIVDVGTFRVFYDSDGLSVPTNYFNSRSGAPMKTSLYHPEGSSPLLNTAARK